MKALGTGGLWWNWKWSLHFGSKSRRYSKSGSGDGGGTVDEWRFPLKPAATSATLVLAGDAIAQIKQRFSNLRLHSDGEENPNSHSHALEVKKICLLHLCLGFRLEKRNKGYIIWKEKKYLYLRVNLLQIMDHIWPHGLSMYYSYLLSTGYHDLSPRASRLGSCSSNDFLWIPLVWTRILLMVSVSWSVYGCY